MGCGPSSSNPRLVELFPPQRQCTDTCWLFFFAFLSTTTAVLVLYHSVTIKNFTEHYVDDFPSVDWGNVAKVLAISTALALLFTIIIASVMQFLTRIMLYIVVIVITAMLLGGSLYFGFQAIFGPPDLSYVQTAIPLVISLVIWLVFLIMAYKRNWLELVLDLYDMAAQIVHDLPALMAFSVLGFIASSIAILVTSLMAAVIGAAIIEDANDNPEPTGRSPILYLAAAFVVLTGLWWKFFLGNCTNFIIGHAVGLWYFAENKKQLDRPLGKGVRNLFYHFGTILFGSFIMAVIELIQSIINAAKNKSQSTGLRVCAMVLLCLISCCKTYWDMLSGNAYYICALFGLSFCESIKLGQELTNLGVTSLFYVIGRAVVFVGVACVTLLTFFITRELVDPIATCAWVTYLIICGVAVAISAMILSLYSTITRALYICVCVDMRRSPSLAFVHMPAVAIIIEKTKGIPTTSMV